MHCLLYEKKQCFKREEDYYINISYDLTKHIAKK